jgi:hypothetical protein
MYVDNMAKHKQTKRKQIVEDDMRAQKFTEFVLIAGL